MNKSFTLMEVLIVVAILGILAAIVLPQYQSHTQQAKEAAAKDNLRILRNAIELYAARHNDVPPGYYPGAPSPSHNTFAAQTYLVTNTEGKTNGSKIRTPEFPYGPYLQAIPKNPFNQHYLLMVINDGDNMPQSATGEYGWIYKPQTREIRLDWPGVDSAGTPYYDY